MNSFADAFQRAMAQRAVVQVVAEEAKKVLDEPVKPSRSAEAEAAFQLQQQAALASFQAHPAHKSATVVQAPSMASLVDTYEGMTDDQLRAEASGGIALDRHAVPGLAEDSAAADLTAEEIEALNKAVDDLEIEPEPTDEELEAAVKEAECQNSAQASEPARSTSSPNFSTTSESERLKPAEKPAPGVPRIYKSAKGQPKGKGSKARSPRS